MATQIPWNRSLNMRLGLLTLLLALTAIAVAILNLYVLREIRQDAAATNLTTRGPARVYQALFLVDEILQHEGARKQQVMRELAVVLEQMDRRFQQLRHGNPAAGIPPTTNPELLADLNDRETQWRQKISPLLQRFADGTTDPATLRATKDALTRESDELIAKALRGVDMHERITDNELRIFQLLQYALLFIVTALAIPVLLSTRGVTRRTVALADTAERIAGGDLTLTAPVSGSDELTALGDSFNAMTSNLRSLLENEKRSRGRLEQVMNTISETASSVTSASAEIVAAATQQAAGSQEQAAAVTETVATVDEVLQTSDQAAERARTVAASAQRSAEISRSGQRAVDETIDVIGRVSEQSEAMAGSILALAEQAQAIGEITATVNDIAEQTNILALNAAIEASRAGEHGKGFAVVASEVKALATQSKKATAQVRQILGEIQKATNSAVIAAEEGTKSVSTATRVVREAGETIRVLAETINEASQTAGQIAASAGQQATGMAQIHQAMRNINQVTHQNVASSRQSERAAQDLNSLAARLNELLNTRT